MKTKILRRKLGAVVLGTAAALSGWSLIAARAQKKSEQPKGAHPAAPRLETETKPPVNNLAYGAKIKEYTTQFYFMTELVDHLPASDKVPSPDKILGYEVGAPGHLTYTKDLYRYYRELEKATPRVRVFTAPEIGRAHV